jgi:hypothetical protein
MRKSNEWRWARAEIKNAWIEFRATLQFIGLVYSGLKIQNWIDFWIDYCDKQIKIIEETGKHELMSWRLQVLMIAGPNYLKPAKIYLRQYYKL